MGSTGGAWMGSRSRYSLSLLQFDEDGRDGGHASYRIWYKVQRITGDRRSALRLTPAVASLSSSLEPHVGNHWSLAAMELALLVEDHPFGIVHPSPGVISP